jgi:hypothetical protein
MVHTRAYEELKAKIAAQSIEEARATPVWKKFQQAGELTEAWRESIKEKLKLRYQQADSDELKQRFAIVWLGPELAKKVYGWEAVGDDSDLLVP